MKRSTMIAVLVRPLAVALLLLMGFSATEAVAQFRQNDEKHAALGAPAFDDPTRVSPNRSAALALGDGEIVVEWGAPHVRGRQLTGGLVSTYKVWRTGANESTVIHFPQDVLIEGELLAAGTYSLFSIGGKKAWTFIFNSDAQQWGAFTYNMTEDVLRVKVDPGTGADSVEEMAFSFENTTDSESDLFLRWGAIEVKLHLVLAETNS